MDKTCDWQSRVKAALEAQSLVTQSSSGLSEDGLSRTEGSSKLASKDYAMELYLEKDKNLRIIPNIEVTVEVEYLIFA